MVTDLVFVNGEFPGVCWG